MHPDRIRLLDAAAGTHGYADLARGAVELPIDGLLVQVAALVDLLRIVLTDHAPYSQRFALALDATLQLTARTPRPADEHPMDQSQARAQADRWLAKQTG